MHSSYTGEFPPRVPREAAEAVKREECHGTQAEESYCNNNCKMLYCKCFPPTHMKILEIAVKAVPWVCLAYIVGYVIAKFAGVTVVPVAN